MESNQSSASASTVLLALLGGAVLGAGIALLYAPQSGRRTRQKLKGLGDDAEDYARELLERAEDGVDQAGRQGKDWLQKGQEFVGDKLRQAGEAIDGAKGSH
jgi:gas vesicle protein